MEILGGLVVVGIIIGITIYAFKKRKNREEERQQELALIEENKQKELEELQLKWKEKEEEISINGLPIVTDGTILLANDDVCHFEGDASLCKFKNEIVGYESGSRGVSLRVMKGVSFRVGNYKGHSIKQEVCEKTKGKICLTSNKIIFSAIKNSSVIKNKDIIALNVIDSMLQIQTTNKTYFFEVDNWFDFLLILEFVIDNKKDNKIDVLLQ
ncbi:MAG: hypothetical protein ACI4MT_04080 [Christensenellales bacterium]